MRINKIVWLFAILLTTAQVLSYLYVLPLSLGPRVVLQPWLIRQGYLLYKNIADEHSPLMYLLLAAIQPLVPNSLEAAKITLVALIALSLLLTFWAAKNSDGWIAGALAMLFFALWSPTFGYGKLWHETFLAPLYTLILIIWRDPSFPKPHNKFYLFFLGIVLGVAILIKQHALAVVISFALWHFLNGWRNKRSTRHLFIEIGLLSFGLLLPISIFVAYYWITAKTMRELVFWLITFNFINHYIQMASLWPSIEQIRVLLPAYILVPPFIAGMLRRNHDDYRSRAELGLLLLVTSSLTIYPRFGFFHLQASLPILAWLSGVTLARFITPWHYSSKESICLIRGLVCSLLLLWVVHAGIPPFFNVLRSHQSRKIYEYSDLVPLASTIRQHIGQVDCIYVLPDDEATANLYYLTHCFPPELWSPTSYPWFMIDAVKPKVIKALESAAPDWVVYFPGRWGIEQHGQELLDYVQRNYQLTAKLSWAEGEVWLLKRKTAK